MSKKMPERTWMSEEFQNDRDRILAGTMASLKIEINRVYDLLTEDELVRFSSGNLPDGSKKQFPTRLAKAILLAVAEDTIDNEWNAETLKPIVTSIKRVLKRRR